MNRKYPKSMFIMGIILKLIKTWYILLLAIIILVIRIFMTNIPIALPFIVLGVWMAYATIAQARDAHILLSMDSEDEFVNKMFADNDRGYRNVIDAVEERIDNVKNAKVDVVGVYTVPESIDAKLVELAINCPPSQVVVGMFSQPDEDQAAYDEHYLNETGTVVIGRFGEIPRNVPLTRIAFFLHFVNYEKPLLTQFGESALPVESPIPDRLKGIIKYVPVD